MTGPTRLVAVVSLLAAVLASAARAQTTEGDVARGQALFEGKGACLDCHRVGTRGSRFGPDLTDIGARAGSLAQRGRGAAREELERALVDPAADILRTNRTVTLVKRDGEAITARVLNEDTFSLQLIDTKERLLTLQKSELRELNWITSSSMPSFRDKLTPAERADLIAYLLSLKGIGK
jgi:putative heme-binding domain-containing protein